MSLSLIVGIISFIAPAGSSSLNDSIEIAGIAVDIPRGNYQDDQIVETQGNLYYAHRKVTGPIYTIEIASIYSPKDTSLSKLDKSLHDRYSSLPASESLEKDATNVYEFNDGKGVSSVIAKDNRLVKAVVYFKDSDSKKQNATAHAIVNSLADNAEAVTVEFKNENTIVDKGIYYVYDSGVEITTPKAEKEKFAFDGWTDKKSGTVPLTGSLEKVKISSDATFYAVFTEQFIAKFVDLDGNEIASVATRVNSKPQAPQYKVPDGYKLVGWDPELQPITADTTYKVKLSHVYTVKFTDGKGKVLSTVKVDEGQAASAPLNNPTSATEDFDGWDADFSHVTSDMTVNAKWTPKPTIAMLNAVKKAKSYLDFTSFSYTGLIEQLEFEGFSHDEAVYGTDHSGADWYAQAVKKAKSYMSWGSFSRSGLIDQLEFEGFTYDQAVHGVDAVGL